MLDLGIQELIVIFIVALIVFGPKRLPELGRALGKGIAELKKTLNGVKEQINSEIGDSDNFLSVEEKLHKTTHIDEKEAKESSHRRQAANCADENKG